MPSGFDRTTLVGPDINHLAVEVKCAAPAPLVVNGASYVGCQLTNGHDGDHSITIKWRS